jgi:hypothetical protein
VSSFAPDCTASAIQPSTRSASLTRDQGTDLRPGRADGRSSFPHRLNETLQEHAANLPVDEDPLHEMHLTGMSEPARDTAAPLRRFASSARITAEFEREFERHPFHPRQIADTKPTSTLPVNVTMAIFGWQLSRSPIVLPDL